MGQEYDQMFQESNKKILAPTPKVKQLPMAIQLQKIDNLKQKYKKKATPRKKLEMPETMPKPSIASNQKSLASSQRIPKKSQEKARISDEKQNKDIYLPRFKPKSQSRTRIQVVKNNDVKMPIGGELMIPNSGPKFPTPRLPPQISLALKPQASSINPPINSERMINIMAAPM